MPKKNPLQFASFNLSPWWIGIVLSAASFVLFQGLAIVPISTIHNSHVFIGVTHLLGVVAPVLFALIAIGSLLISAKNHPLTHRDELDGLCSVPSSDFEAVLIEWFRQQGHEPVARLEVSAEGPPVHHLRHEDRDHLVTFRRWKRRAIDLRTMLDFAEIIRRMNAHRGTFVSTTHFTPEAVALAGGAGIILVEPRDLLSMIREANPKALARFADYDHEFPLGKPCPKCTTILVLVTTRNSAMSCTPALRCPQCMHSETV